jgi:carbon-monoxide dehydrogenase medium subunit
VKPARFSYQDPASVGEALEVLETYGADAKVLAGGQSLMPMMNFRLTRPTVLVDINRLGELAYIREQDGGLAVGALTRHRAVERSAMIARTYPPLSYAMRFVAHPPIRNRGTMGGSLSHNDPAAEWPLLAVTLDARLTVASARRGRQSVAARNFFVHYLTTALAPDDLLTEAWFPPWPPGAGWAFREVARRQGDFALVAVAVVVSSEQGRLRDVRIGVGGAGPTALRMTEAETMLQGRTGDGEAFREAAELAARAVDPPGDLHASPAFRRQLTRALVEEALTEAWARRKEHA